MANYKINLDSLRTNSSQNKVTQSDTYTLELTLTERGKNFVPAVGSSFVLVCERADHVSFTQQTGITFHDNIVLVTLDVRAISVPGHTPCNLIVTNATLGTVTTFIFNLIVMDVVLSNQTTSSQYRDGMITALINSTKAPFIDPATGVWMEFNEENGLIESTGYEARVYVVSTDRISGNGVDGETDTYEMTYSDGNVTTFEVTNGATGQKGDTGESGVYTGTEEPTDPEIKVWINPEGTLPSAQNITIADAANNFASTDVEGVLAELSNKSTKIINTHRSLSSSHFANTLLAGRSSLVLNVISDSTGNENTEWVYTLGQYLGTKCPNYNVKYKLYNAGLYRYDAWVTLQNAGIERSLRICSGTCPYIDYADVPITSDDIDISFKLSLDDWTPGVTKYLISRYGDLGSRCWYLCVNADNRFQFTFLQDGVAATATIYNWDTSVLSNGQSYWFRFKVDVNDGSGHYIFTLFQSTDNGVTWVVKGSPYTGANSITIDHSETVPYYLGGTKSGAALVGNFYELLIRDGIDGYVVNYQPIEQYLSGSTDDYNADSVVGNPTIYIYNASIPGLGTVDALTDTYCKRIVVPCYNSHTIISLGLNDTIKCGSSYVAVYHAFVEAIKVIQPQQNIYVMTQNPIKSPAINIRARDMRRSDQMCYCAKNNINCIDNYINFITDSRGISALLATDGLHPNAIGEEIILQSVIDYLGL